jgi:hypothetical protein
MLAEYRNDGMVIPKVGNGHFCGNEPTIATHRATIYNIFVVHARVL